MVMLHDGHVLWQGTPAEIRMSENPIVQRFLAGEATPEELAGIHGMHGDDPAPPHSNGSRSAS
jgi:ABC-type transporter Mla maintaining outer membrane lipid asymmetry ATPase subunit MlaF